MSKYSAFFLLFFILIACDSETETIVEPLVPPTTTPPEKGDTYWWNEGVFYEIFVRSFYDSDGDGIGDLRGVIEKLDYLNDGDPNTTMDLGVTGIWLMPINESPSYHGYDVTNYRVVNPDYGTNEDFKELMNAAHARGIKIIMDLVVNHTSSQHTWFQQSRDGDMNLRDWYLWNTTKPTYDGPWGQNVWHGNSGNYYYGVFWSEMPDLNFDNEAVKDEIKDITEFWLTEMNVDGFRLDAAKHIVENGPIQDNTQGTLDWWSEFNQTYKGVNPEALAVGEVWDQTSVVLNYLDNRLDFCFEFDLAQDILTSINASDPESITEKMDVLTTEYPYHQYGTFLTNHDQNRTIGTLRGNLTKNILAASVYLTLPGIPFLYYGEEIAMRGNKPDELIRTPMLWDNSSNAGFTSSNPWIRVNSNYTTFNVSSLEANENSVLNRYKSLIQLRNSHSELSVGTYQEVFSNSEGIYAYLRYDDGEAVLVIHNFASIVSDEVELTLSTTNLGEGTYNLTDLLNEDFSDEIQINKYGGFQKYVLSEIGAYETLLLKIKK